MTGKLEADLYPAVKALLETQGYEVKGEVEDCDVVAVRGDESPVVVELKLNLNLTLVMQAVERLALTDKVYIAVPMTCTILGKPYKRLKKTLRMLGLGLISVDPGKKGHAQVLFDPQKYQPKKSSRRKDRLLGEFEHRVGDPNAGGSDRRRGLMTAYRQRAIRIASYLNDHGQTKAALVARELDEPKARDILYRDVYGWFDGHGAGLYTLSPRGSDELGQWAPPDK